MNYTVTGEVNNFYQEQTKVFQFGITRTNVEGVESTPDLTSDTVTVTFSLGKSLTPVLTKDADVTSSGADGKAIFTLTAEDTDINNSNYFIQVWWYLSNGQQFPLYDTEITVYEKQA